VYTGLNPVAYYKIFQKFWLPMPIVS
jgi:hypothetical protein